MKPSSVSIQTATSEPFLREVARLVVEIQAMLPVCADGRPRRNGVQKILQDKLGLDQGRTHAAVRRAMRRGYLRTDYHRGYYLVDADFVHWREAMQP